LNKELTFMKSLPPYCIEKIEYVVVYRAAFDEPCNTLNMSPNIIRKVLLKLNCKTYLFMNIMDPNPATENAYMIELTMNTALGLV
jgi:hypothetical protein